MVEELTLAIKIDDESIEKSLLQQFSNAQKMADKVVLDFKNVNFDDKEIEAKFKDLQKQAGQNPIDLSINKDSIQMLSQISDKLGDIFKIAQGKSIIDSSSTNADIGKIENKLNELSNKCEDLQKKISSSISGEDISLIDNKELKQLQEDVALLKNEINGLQTNLEKFEQNGNDTGAFVQYLSEQIYSAWDNIEKLTSKLEELHSVVKKIKSGSPEDFVPDQKNETQDEFKKLAEQTQETVQAKKDFAAANDGVQSSVDGSKSPLQLEAELMDQIAQSAREAAHAKKEFVEANKQVEKSADDSNSKLGQETNSFKQTSQFAEEYSQSVVDNEKNILAILKQSDDEFENHYKLLSEHGFGSKSFSAKLQRNDGQTENWYYQKNQQGTYDRVATSRSTDYQKLEKTIIKADNDLRDLEALKEKVLKDSPTASTVNIDAQIASQKEYISLLEQTVNYLRQSNETMLKGTQIDKARNKAMEEYYLKQGVKSDVQNASQSASDEQKLQSSVNTALKDQEEAWKNIQLIKEKIAKTDDESKIVGLEQQEKYYQQMYIEADKILKANSSLYDEESQLAKLEKSRLDTNERISAYKNQKINKAINNQEEKVASLPEHEKLQSNLNDVIKAVDDYNKKLKNGEITVKEYNDTINKLISNYKKMVTVQNNRDAMDQKQADNQFNKDWKDAIKFNQQLDDELKTTQTLLNNLDMPKELLSDWDKVTDDVEDLTHQLKNGTLSLSQFKKQRDELLNGYNGKIKIQQKRDKEEYDASTKEENESKLERQKALVKELNSVLKEYSSLQSKIAKGQGTNEDANEAEKLLNTIHELQRNELLPSEKLNASNEKLKEIRDNVDKIRNSVISSYDNKLTGYNTKSSGYEAVLQRFQDDGWASDEYKSQVAQLQSNIEKYKAALNELRNNPELISENKLKNLDEFDQKIKDSIVSINNMSASQKGFTKLSGEKALSKINSLLHENSAMSREAKNQIQYWYNQIKSGNPSASLDVILGKVQEIVNAEIQAGRGGKSMMDAIKEKVFYGIAGTISSYLGLNDIIQYGKQAAQTVIELDTALIDLKKTTSMSSSDLKNFYYDANDVAKQMGVTTQEIIDQASAWSRLNKIGLLYGDI